MCIIGIISGLKVAFWPSVYFDTVHRETFETQNNQTKIENHRRNAEYCILFLAFTSMCVLLLTQGCAFYKICEHFQFLRIYIKILRNVLNANFVLNDGFQIIWMIFKKLPKKLSKHYANLKVLRFAPFSRFLRRNFFKSFLKNLYLRFEIGNICLRFYSQISFLK